MNTVVSEIIANDFMFVLYLYSFKIMDALCFYLISVQERMI